jgi:hypothetical protein
LYGAMTAFISRLNFRHLFIKWSISKKWFTESSAICRRSSEHW